MSVTASMDVKLADAEVGKKINRSNDSWSSVGLILWLHAFQRPWAASESQEITWVENREQASGTRPGCRGRGLSRAAVLGSEEDDEPIPWLGIWGPRGLEHAGARALDLAISGRVARRKLGRQTPCHSHVSIPGPIMMGA
jgi:hypothetical protein